MSKKLTWLDKFAEEQAEKMQKTAALNKKAEQIIVSPEDVPGAANGSEVSYNNAKYKVVDASYEDEIGLGVILEKCSDDEDIKKEAALEDETPVEETPAVTEPVEQTMDAPVAEVPAGGKKLTDEPERARTNPGDVYSIGDVRDQVESAKFNAEANETAQQLAQENAKDRTTPEGKYSTNPILNNIVNGPAEISAPSTEVAPVTETPVVEEVSVEETPVEEIPVEEVPVEETPVEEIPVEETPAEDDTTDETVNETENEEDPLKKAVGNRILKRIINSYKK